jgi:1,4-alpha-glucan branching enzyme
VSCKSKKAGNSMAGKVKKTKKSRKKLLSTEFVIMAPEAQKVFLTGDFNNWNPSEFSMRKFKNGGCKKKVKLKPGRYEYQFIVEGNWLTDPENLECCATPFGTENSVINVIDEVYVF